MADTMKKVTEKADELKKEAAKAAEEVKPVAEKAKAEVKKTVKTAKAKAEKVAKKAAPKAAKKTTAKAAKAPKAAKTAEAAPVVYVQYMGAEENVEDLVASAKAAFAAEHSRTKVTDLKLYVKPEERAAYYVINEKFAGRIDF